MPLEKISTLHGHEGRVWGISWSADGNLLASVGEDRVIRVWGQDRRTEDFRTLCILEESQTRTIRHCCWSPCGRFLAAASFDGTCAIWERDGEDDHSLGFELRAVLEGHENEVKSVAFNPSGTLLATCGRDKSVWIWDIDVNNEYECEAVLHGHSQDVKVVKWHPTEEMLFSAGYDECIKIWAQDMIEAADWKCQDTLKGHTHTVWDLTFNSDGQRMASCAGNGKVMLWDTFLEGNLRKWRTVATVTVSDVITPLFSIDWHRDMDIIAVGDQKNAVTILRTNGRDDAFVIEDIHDCDHQSDVNCVRWNPGKGKESMAASCSDDESITLWKYNYD